MTAFKMVTRRVWIVEVLIAQHAPSRVAMMAFKMVTRQVLIAEEPTVHPAPVPLVMMASKMVTRRGSIAEELIVQHVLRLAVMAFKTEMRRALIVVVRIVTHAT